MMDACSNSGRPGFAKDEGTGFQKSWVVILLGHTEARREVVRADKNAVEPLHRKNLVEVLHRWDTLDIGKENVAGVVVFDICLQLRFQVFALERPSCPLSLERTQFARPYH